jgi:urea carboxylase
MPKMPKTQAVLVEVPATADHPGYLIRLAGDRYVQIEYGPMELDITLR